METLWCQQLFREIFKKILLTKCSSRQTWTVMMDQWCVNSGNTAETRGSAYVIYEDIFDAKNACDHLSGFNVCNRYLVVLYYQPNKVRLCWCCLTSCISYLLKGQYASVSMVYLLSSWNNKRSCILPYLTFGVGGLFEPSSAETIFVTRPSVTLGY